MGQWTAQTQITAPPADVLGLLTEPNAISRWAPIDFKLIDWDGERLMAGEHVRVQGHLAGRALEFEVDVAEADDGNLILTACGPIRLDVEYHARALEIGSELSASVHVTGRGLFGRLLAQATDALLAGGALRTAVDRLARELEPAFAA
jgi:polyketide cyclase/dehydrase/lipid transport protein